MQKEKRYGPNYPHAKQKMDVSSINKRKTFKLYACKAQKWTQQASTKEKHPEHNKKHCQKNSRRNVLRQAYFDNAFQRIISSITYSACVACSTKIRRISSYSPSPFITQVTGKPAASNRLLQESELAPAISLVA